MLSTALASRSALSFAAASMRFRSLMSRIAADTVIAVVRCAAGSGSPRSESRCRPCAGRRARARAHRSAPPGSRSNAPTCLDVGLRRRSGMRIRADCPTSSARVYPKRLLGLAIDVRDLLVRSDDDHGVGADLQDLTVPISGLRGGRRFGHRIERSRAVAPALPGEGSAFSARWSPAWPAPPPKNETQFLRAVARRKGGVQ